MRVRSGSRRPSFEHFIGVSRALSWGIVLALPWIAVQGCSSSSNTGDGGTSDAGPSEAGPSAVDGGNGGSPEAGADAGAGTDASPNTLEGGSDVGSDAPGSDASDAAGEGGGSGHVIYAGTSGSDTNPGTMGAPFRTLKKAVSVAVAGDTIHLLDGTFQAGPMLETWGYVLPPNVTIVGDSTLGTVLDGQMAGVDGIDVSPGTTLQSLTITNFNNGVAVQAASSMVTLTDVRISGSANAAIDIEGTATGSAITFGGTNGEILETGSLTSGVLFNLAGGVTFTMTGGTVLSAADAFHFTGSCPGSSLSVTGGTVTQTAQNGVLHAISNAPGAPNSPPVTISIANATVYGTVYDNDPTSSLTITGSTLTEANGAGDAVDFYGKTLSISGNTTITMQAGTTPPNTSTAIGYHGVAGNSSTMSLDGVTILGGGVAIVQDAAESAATLRNTTVTTQYGNAYQISGGTLDLGKMGDPGHDSLALPSQPNTIIYWALYVNGGIGSGVAVTSDGSTLGGVDPGGQAQPLVVAPTTAPVLSGTEYYVSPGSTVTFY